MITVEIPESVAARLEAASDIEKIANAPGVPAATMHGLLREAAYLRIMASLQERIERLEAGR